LNDLERFDMSEVDYGAYAKATVPAVDPSIHDISVEEAAKARVNRILRATGGELEYNISQVHSEILQAERNLANGYDDARLRLQMLNRVIEILRTRGYA
jgi:hypothetical protein